MLKMWWSVDFLSLLLALHLEYMAQYSASEQSLDWLEEKLADAEEEQEKTAKNQKLAVELSVKLTATLDKFSIAFVTSHANNNASIDVKLNNFKNELFQWLGVWQQAAEARISSKLEKKLGNSLGFNRWLIFYLKS